MTPTPLPRSPWDFAPGDWPHDDCIATGADLAPETIVAAYGAGAFPMPHEGIDEMFWWSPVERGVLRIEDLVVSRSLRRSASRLTVSIDTAFGDVIRACADPTRPGAWIDGRMIEAYEELHALGWAHSVETRNAAGDLVGGLYGLAIGGLFAGESMFHTETDASKVALVGLVDALDDDVDRLVDVQWRTSHLATLGVQEWPRKSYLEAVASLIHRPLPQIWA